MAWSLPLHSFDTQTTCLAPASLPDNLMIDQAPSCTCELTPESGTRVRRGLTSDRHRDDALRPAEHKGAAHRHVWCLAARLLHARNPAAIEHRHVRHVDWLSARHIVTMCATCDMQLAVEPKAVLKGCSPGRRAGWRSAGGRRGSWASARPAPTAAASQGRTLRAACQGHPPSWPDQGGRQQVQAQQYLHTVGDMCRTKLAGD